MKDSATTLHIMTIDNERYAVPYKYKDGKLIRSIDDKIKLPIEITPGFHINRRSSYEPPKSLLSRLVNYLLN